MSDDLRRLLHGTAPEPTRPLDAAGVVRRAHRQTIGLRVAAGGAVLALTALAAVALPGLWDDTSPQIANTPPGGLVTAPIGVLDTPAGPDDQLPGWVAGELQIDPDAGVTARLARRTPGRAFYVYVDDTPTGPQARRGPSVCVAAVDDLGQGGVQAACGPRQVPSRRHALTVLMSDVGAVGIVPDGITSARDVADGDQLPDVPVVNNLFIDPAPPSNAALEGRSDDAFCAVAPMPAGDPESLVASDDPMGLLEQMATTAPAGLADDVYLVWDYLRVHPDAILPATVAFPDHVEPVATRVDDYIRTACSSTTAGTGSAPWCPGDARQVAQRYGGTHLVSAVSTNVVAVRDWQARPVEPVGDAPAPEPEPQPWLQQLDADVEALVCIYATAGGTESPGDGESFSLVPPPPHARPYEIFDGPIDDSDAGPPDARPLTAPQP